MLSLSLQNVFGAGLLFVALSSNTFGNEASLAEARGVVFTLTPPCPVPTCGTTALGRFLFVLYLRPSIRTYVHR